jgi:hypothetical protein
VRLQDCYRPLQFPVADGLDDTLMLIRTCCHVMCLQEAAHSAPLIPSVTMDPSSRQHMSARTACTPSVLHMLLISFSAAQSFLESSGSSASTSHNISTNLSSAAAMHDV